MVTMEEVVGFDAMPTHLRVAASVLQYRLQELIASAGGGEGGGEGPEQLRNKTESLKRVLERASKVLVASGGGAPHEDGRGRELGAKRVATEELVRTMCRHSCEHHEELMDPSLWSTLPETVRYGIFARLPLPKVITLQGLSKSWKLEMNGVHRDAANGDVVIQSEFLRMCEEVHQKVGLITRAKENLFWVRLLDVKSNQWHALQISAGEPGAVDITAASEAGGLVCFVSVLKKPRSKIFVVHVVNPLTKRSMKLPPLPKMSLVKMAKIVFDAGTKKFTVLVVGDDWRTGDLVALVHDQDAESWSNALTWTLKKKKQIGCLFGYAYHWGNLRYSQKRDTPCSYDFVSKSLWPLKEVQMDDGRSSPLTSTHVKSFAQLEDRVFVLRRDKFGPSASAPGSNRASPAYYIVEYSVTMRPRREWSKLKAHACKPFENPPKAKYDLSLFACKDYLMVFARFPEEAPYRNEVAWLYDLATCKWSDLPKLPGEKPYDVHDLMCGLHWNSLGQP